MAREPMTEADAAALTRVLNERGYLVLQASCPLFIGEILPDVDCCGTSTGHPARVIGKTDRADWDEQTRRTGFGDRPGRIYQYFYRVVTD